MKYWPENSDFKSGYEEEEYSTDQEEQFDVVRANISNKSLNRLIRRACENDMLPPSQKKWTLRELDFIEGEDGEEKENPSLNDW